MTTTPLKLHEDDILKLILDFLTTKKLYRTARIFEKETNVVNCPYSESIAFLRELVLDGEWQELQEFSQPLEEIPDFECRKFHFLVARQQYFEILFEKCEGNVKNERELTDNLLSCLRKLEKYCSHRDEYNKLYWYLSAPSLRTEPEFLSWNVDFSRMLLFEEILALMKQFVPLEEYQSSSNQLIAKDRLLGLISKGLLYENCIEFCQKRATHKAHASDFSLSNIKTDLFRVQSSKSTGNFYSWLHNLAPENFVIPFEEIAIDVLVEKQKANLKRANMRTNSLTKSLTFESRNTMKNFQRDNKSVQKHGRNRLSDYSRPPDYMPQFDKGGRDVSQSWADFNFMPRGTHIDRKPVPHNRNTPRTNSASTGGSSGDNGRDNGTYVVQNSNNTSAGIKHGYTHGKSPTGALEDGHLDGEIISPRTTKQDQQELVLQRLEEHKKKQKELHQQLADLTTSLTKEDNKSTVTENDQLGTINGVIESEVSSKSMEVLRKSKESLSFLNRMAESPRTTAPPYQPEALNIADENKTEDDSRRLSSVSLEPKTPVNTCLPPGLVKLADGSGTFNTSTPKNRKHAYMTPPPPASPVSLEQKASFDEPPSRQFQQKKPPLRDQNVSRPTPKRSTPVPRQMVARTLANDIMDEQKSPLPDETFAIKRKEPFSTLTKELKFHKVAVLGDTQAIRSVAFHPNGNYFAVGTNSKSLKLCSCRHLEFDQHTRDDNDKPQQPEVVFNRTPIHKGSVYCIAFSPRGDVLATGSNDKLIKLLRFDEDNVQTMKGEIELAIHTATVRDLSFLTSASSPSILASGGAGGGLIFLSDCTTGQTISSLQGHSGNIMTVFAGSHQNLLCSGSADKSVRVWDLRVPKCVDVITSSSCVASVCFNHEGGPIHLASAHENGQCMIYDITAKKQLSIFQPHTMDCRTIRYSPDSKYLLTGSYDASIVVTSVQHGSVSELLLHPFTAAKHNDKVIQCRWHPSDYAFLSSSADKTVALWQWEGT